MLLSIVDDSDGHHDTLTDFANPETTLAQYGPGRNLELRNGYHRNTRDNLVAALGRHGLGRRDVVPTFNLFARVVVDPDGALRWVQQPARRGAWIELRAEMNVRGAAHCDGPWVAERYAAVGAFLGQHRAPDVDPIVEGIVLGARDLRAVDAYEGVYRLAELQRATEDVWRHVDLLVLPTTPMVPTIDDVAADPLGVNARLGTVTNFVNLLDRCAVSVPAPQPGPGAPPAGVSVIGRAGADEVAMAVAAGLDAGTTAEGARTAADGRIEVAVVGAHLRGQPFNGELLQLGAQFVRATTTAPAYRLSALPDSTRPGCSAARRAARRSRSRRGASTPRRSARSSPGSRRRCASGPSSSPAACGSSASCANHTPSSEPRTSRATAAGRRTGGTARKSPPPSVLASLAGVLPRRATPKRFWERAGCGSGVRVTGAMLGRCAARSDPVSPPRS